MVVVVSVLVPRPDLGEKSSSGIAHAKVEPIHIAGMVERKVEGLVFFASSTLDSSIRNGSRRHVGSVGRREDGRGVAERRDTGGVAEGREV